MFDSSVEGLGRRIGGKPEDMTLGDTRHGAGAGDEQEAERAHAAEQIGVGPFAERRRAT